MRYLTLVGVLGTFLGLAGAGLADEEAEKILKKAIAAHGGAEVLAKNKNKAVTQKAKGHIHHFNTDATIELFSAGGKTKQVMQLTIMGMEINQIVCFDGKEMWTARNGKVEKSFSSKEELAAIEQQHHAVRAAGLLYLQEKGIGLSPNGETTVEGKPAVGIRVSKKDYKDVNLYFDKESGLLVKIESMTFDLMSGGEVAEERTITAYQTVAGQKRPAKVNVVRDGMKVIDVEFTETNLVDKLDDDTFAKP
jgi:hypothetical protein